MPASMLAVLNFALALEYLEAKFYMNGVTASELIPTSISLSLQLSVGMRQPM